MAFVDEKTLNEIDATSNNWDGLAAPSGLVGALKDCLSRLGDGPREVVQLIYFEGFTSEETAARLERSAAAIRKQLQRVREQLRDCMNEKSVQRGAI